MILGKICVFANFAIRTRQIIRYQATATLRRQQIKQYTASNERGGGVTKTNRTTLNWIKYVTVHPTVVSENYTSSGMLRILIKGTKELSWSWLISIFLYRSCIVNCTIHVQQHFVPLVLNAHIFSKTIWKEISCQF